MDIVLIHLGGPEPEHLWDCVEQIRAVCDNRIVVVLEGPQCFDTKKTHDASVFTLSDLIKTESWKQFNEISYFKDFGGLPLWGHACTRFYVLEALMAVMGLDEVLHLEYDNMIYGPPDEKYLREKYGKHVGLTEITETLLSAGVMYVGERAKLTRMNMLLNSLMEAGADALSAKYGPEMMHEMRMLKIISEEHPEVIKLLPIFPEEDSKYVYDCASWGQFVGGTVFSPGISYHDDSHIIGRQINKTMWDVTWESRNGLKTPVLTDTSYHSTQFFNLHIHSKELSKWNFKCQK